MSTVTEVKSVSEVMTELKRAHVRIMKNKLTYLYSGVLLLGKSEVRSDIPTACTDGVNKYYGHDFISKLPIEQLCGIVLHENLHVILKHLPRHRDLIKENARLANVAMDYVVNSIIKDIQYKDKTLCALPDSALFDAKFGGWTVREVYNFLKSGKDKNGNSEGKPRDNGDGTIRIGGRTYGGDTLDEHDATAAQEMTNEQIADVSAQIDRAIHQSSIIAGVMGGEAPRALTELLEPVVDWRDVMRDYVTTATSGASEYTYRQYNRRRLADDMYRPSTINERVGRLIVAIDTSGSIGSKEIGAMCGELASICETCNPEEVVVLWWDTKVHGVQTFNSNYENLADVLKPVGGGGTRVACVSDYIEQHHLDADCMVVLTDGYVESNVQWNVGHIPTLWVVTERDNFTPPSGRLVKYKGE